MWDMCLCLPVCVFLYMATRGHPKGKRNGVVEMTIDCPLTCVLYTAPSPSHPLSNYHLEQP